MSGGKIGLEQDSHRDAVANQRCGMRKEKQSKAES